MRAAYIEDKKEVQKHLDHPSPKKKEYDDEEEESEEEEDSKTPPHEEYKPSSKPFERYAPREMQGCPYADRKKMEDDNVPKPKKKKKKKKKEEEEAPAEPDPVPEPKSPVKGKGKSVKIEEPPAPPSPKKKEKKAKKPKKKEPEPEIPPPPMPKDERFDLPNLMRSKISQNILTTENLSAKKEEFDRINKITEEFSNIAPQTDFLGKNHGVAKIDPKDEWDRRNVKQLDDIPFDDSEETAEIRLLQKIPGTVITDDSLKKTLNPGTTRLILDNHYWVSFIDKIGRMAPNLKHLSLRGLNMSNDFFVDCVKYMNHL